MFRVLPTRFRQGTACLKRLAAGAVAVLVAAAATVAIITIVVIVAGVFSIVDGAVPVHAQSPPSTEQRLDQRPEQQGARRHAQRTERPTNQRTEPPTGPRTAARTALRQVSLIVTNGILVTVDGDRRVLSPGALAIDGSDIVAVDTPQAIRARFKAKQTIDAAGQVVMPGLINTHTHAPMVLYRGLADDLALMDWLQKYIFPAEAKTVSPAFVRTGTQLAALEMIRSGTTTFADMYYFEEEVAKATKEAGLRGVLGETIIKFPVADAKTPEAALARTRTFISQWKGDPLIVPAVAPHSPYTLEGETLKQASALAREEQVPLLIHLAETSEEVGIILDRYRRSPTAFLDSLGILGPEVLAAHGVFLSTEDIAVLKARGVSVSHNPESNMKLASGTAPVTKYLRAGVPVGLGTDGAASNNDLDMFEAMRVAAFLHKLQLHDPKAMPAALALELATRQGARALGLDTQIGSLEVGKRADVIIVSMRSARQTPMYDPVSHLVYATRGDDVQTMIVHGKVLMRDRKVLTLDEPRVLAAARAAAVRVREAVGKEGASPAAAPAAPAAPATPAAVPGTGKPPAGK